MSHVIVLSADYPHWPLRRPSGIPAGGPISEHELPLSEPTKDRIRAWFNQHADRPDWPTWTAPAGLDDLEVEQAWIDEGAAIRELVQSDLGSDYLVFYEP